LIVPSSQLLWKSDQKTENSTNYVDSDKCGQVHGTPGRSDFDPTSVKASSALELFSISEDDRHSVEGSLGQRDSLFSTPEPEASTMDSNTSVASDKRDEVATPGHLDSYNWAGQGNDQGRGARPFPRLIWQLSKLRCNRRSHRLGGRCNGW